MSRASSTLALAFVLGLIASVSGCQGAETPAPATASGGQTRGAGGASAMSRRPGSSGGPRSGVAPRNPNDPWGLETRLDGRETNGQVFLSVYRSLCTRLEACGFPKPFEQCVKDAMGESCGDVTCDAVFTENRGSFSACAKGYGSMPCDSVHNGTLDTPAACENLN